MGKHFVRSRHFVAAMAVVIIGWIFFATFLFGQKLPSYAPGSLILKFTYDATSVINFRMQAGKFVGERKLILLR
jgi:hypothetical protein